MAKSSDSVKSAALWGTGEGVLNGPSVCKPFPDHLVFYPNTLAQFSKTGGDSSKSYDLVGSGVPHLLFVSRPTAVSWLVVSVVVDAVNFPAWRLLAHVSKKVFKNLPSLTNLYSSASVSRKTFDVWIRTSGFHSSPNTPRFAHISSPCVSVNEIAKRCRFSAKASARASTACHQLRVSHLNPCAAITNAKAHSVRATAWFSTNSSICNYSKSCEFPPDQTESFRHNVAFINVLFSGGRPATTGARCDSFLPLLTGGFNG